MPVGSILSILRIRQPQRLHFSGRLLGTAGRVDASWGSSVHLALSVFKQPSLILLLCFKGVEEVRPGPY